jgi:hypothetical protein
MSIQNCGHRSAEAGFFARRRAVCVNFFIYFYTQIVPQLTRPKGVPAIGVSIGGRNHARQEKTWIAICTSSAVLSRTVSWRHGPRRKEGVAEACEQARHRKDDGVNRWVENSRLRAQKENGGRNTSPFIYRLAHAAQLRTSEKPSSDDKIPRRGPAVFSRSCKNMV